MTKKKLTPAEALDLPFEHEEVNTETIRDYFIELLSALWYQGESFSGKRPFGNSGWERDLLLPLVLAGVVKGTIVGDPEDDTDGRAWVKDFDKTAYDKFVFEMIDVL